MTLIRNLFFLFSLTVFAIASTLLAVFNFNPFTADHGKLANFYISLFFSLAGITGTVIFYIKTRLLKSESVNPFFWPSIRQGLLISAGITALLMLQGYRILDWLVGSSIIIVAVLLELFFQTKKRTSK